MSSDSDAGRIFYPLIIQLCLSTSEEATAMPTKTSMTNTTANEKYNSNEKKVLIWLWTDADAEFLTPQLFNFVSAAELILRHILSEPDMFESVLLQYT